MITPSDSNLGMLPNVSVAREDEHLPVIVVAWAIRFTTEHQIESATVPGPTWPFRDIMLARHGL